eukprot:2108831-Amphidinium_carterae.2
MESPQMRDVERTWKLCAGITLRVGLSVTIPEPPAVARLGLENNGSALLSMSIRARRTTFPAGTVEQRM